MATGLEALGAASAVIQLISFAGSLISLSFKIYDGMPTPENELEEYSTKMMEAARRVQSRGTKVPKGTQVGDKLSKVSQECINAATELKKESQTLTKRCQKGKMFKAVYSAFRAESHKTKLNQLNESLKKCKELMETELLLKICDQNTATAQQQSQGFQSLATDVQNLIFKIAEGFTRVEQLVSIEAQVTRDAINTHVTSEFKALGIKNITDNQRQRLLKSLKPEEIRERYNSVLPSSDACFERVFASYERVCRKDQEYKAWEIYERAFADESDNESEKARFEEEVDEIDHIWECFSTWLQSDDILFWIRGKPGSGKSTLIKFVINNDNTKRLLGSWQPNTRLLSHFFWKIGSEPQNSIKGLLCSLLHDLLLEDVDAIDNVLREFKFSQSKDSYREWSSQEAEKIFLYLLDTGAYSTCIFIDGLDEISNKDGYRALVSVVQRLTSCQRVKVCVSSRPETELVKRLERIGVQSLRLDDLTKPEMVVYLRKEFERLPQDQSADLALEDFIYTLLAKSQGVFLWLALATRSVINGITNGDDQKILSQRLQELPEELESLYQKMWERLNGNDRVYRETAARYFRFVIADGWGTTLYNKDGSYAYMREPNLIQLSLAINVEDSFIFPPKADAKKLFELTALCAATESDVQTRCAGMLQVARHSALDEKLAEFPDAMYPLTRQVQFIHRTAHDFLIDTEAGQSIVNYKSNETTSVDTELKLLKCQLSLINTWYHELGVASFVSDALRDCNRLNNKGANPNTILEALNIIKDLYENGALINPQSWAPTRSFPCVAAFSLDSFEDFVISSFVPTPSPELATNSLHELALASRHMGMSELSVKICRGMVGLGADAHVAKRSDLWFQLPEHKTPITKHTTAFETLICTAIQSDSSSTGLFLDVIEILVQTCPDLHKRFILFIDRFGVLLCHIFNPSKAWLMLEVDLQFLITKLLTVADRKNIRNESNNRMHELAASFIKPHARVRYIAGRGGEPGYQSVWAHCYRVLDQEPFLDIIDSFWYGEKSLEVVARFEHDVDAINIRNDGSTLSNRSFPLKSLEKVSIGEQMDMLIQEGVGLYREEKVSIG
ncbi:hypothetical protein NOF04DRAFT_9406 [Fusarium oxysporum II5]|uniref:Uncharacterized protein n=2 Tax=Fusarium oxysporum species complex TaxID=171631 RepID=X0KIM2_FUSO5|nr:uncharacterized protein FOIG_11092 [Fusarium odoratissimum NRRL 54006]EXL96734.1 hypothetical protein FOIG_11092 [Fusarium odoratissimum NRRL 54006]KAK2136115.1 hypothetical protein NOF04DRAFT_9406 [Fusarium oxysporum II5]